MHLAQSVGLEYREKINEKIQRKVRQFFGIEHRLRKEEVEEQFNTEAEEGWRFAADAARITDERANNDVLVAPKEASRCRSKGPKKVSGSKGSMIR